MILDELKLHEILKKIISEMPVRSTKVIPFDEELTNQGLNKVGAVSATQRPDVGASIKSFTPRLLRSPETLQKVQSSSKMQDYYSRIFANKNLNFTVIVQPTDNALVNYFDEIYRWGGHSKSADRILIIPPGDLLSIVNAQYDPNKQWQKNIDFKVIFPELSRDINNWCQQYAPNAVAIGAYEYQKFRGGEIQTDNSQGDKNECLFIVLGDSLENQTNSNNQTRFFAKTPWIVVHSMFNSISFHGMYIKSPSQRIRNLAAEYVKRYTNFQNYINSIWSNDISALSKNPQLKNYSSLYPYLKFTAGAKRSRLDAKIADNDLENELLTAFLNYTGYAGVEDGRKNAELASAILVNDASNQVVADFVNNIIPKMRKVIDVMFEMFKGNIVISVTETPQQSQRARR
jgi:hypothetical protein